ncbi:MAG: UDP-N-acetylglucosamine--N-acetylmuramyl-(pentapeptide) pyrophosphoryl-undecaprenol N-acetylglucosamine transferase [Gammaproteobacteria bacterium]|jgi:UDP-N-acetylglucosamine--N-acetylmuramyl-(pentapeptide) pyrophosphoryl-undecaprenol N-acetylglucosamine transferase|nr:UDP-N-acetylglucosamine--N-acetylmuramyl-(pentapeptide) pyrophosphoryl-undecaprenol N-acetylglucosamine transferase [Gammaproteobacteria bacterium]
MSKARLVLIAAGGTGGHMFPAAAFAEEMQRRGWQVGLVSDERGLRYAGQFPADWKQAVEAASPNFRKPWTLPGAFMKLNAGIGTAARLIAGNRPELVAGFGGYPAFPALAAARRKRVPMLIHEQNAVLGRVNRRFARQAAAVVSGFARLDRLPAGARHVPLGNPVRAPIAAMREAPFPDPEGPLNILITGGSQGARILGEALPLAICNHLPETIGSRLTVVQQVREEQVGEVVRMYANAGITAEIDTFFSDMPERLAAAHLVIARSGAGTVSEIAAVGRPSILIPLKIAMDDHQAANAEALTDIGAADLVLEDNLYPKLLGELLGARLGDGPGLRERAAAARAAGSVTAASDLADLAEQVAERGAATS